MACIRQTLPNDLPKEVTLIPSPRLPAAAHSSRGEEPASLSSGQGVSHPTEVEVAAGDAGACPRWAPSGGISGGEREQSRQRRAAATAQGVLGLRTLNPAQAGGALAPLSLDRQAGKLTAGTRCESAAPRCGKAEILPLQPHRVLGSAGVGGGGGGRVPLPPASRVAVACRLPLPLHPVFPLVPTLGSALASCRAAQKSPSPRETSPDSIHLKLQTLPTPDASFPPPASFPPRPPSPSHTLHLKHIGLILLFIRT